jgi:hypothetical protein
VQELIAKGDAQTATEILEQYAATINQEDPDARRRVARGLPELVALYSADPQLLERTIQQVGMQLCAEREPELKVLGSEAFTQLTQAAMSSRHYSAVLRALTSLDRIEAQRLGFSREMAPRLGLEQRLPEFIDMAIRTAPDFPAGLIELLTRVARPTIEELVERFNRSSRRSERGRIVQVARLAGPEISSYLRETLELGPAFAAANVTGLLSILDAPAVEKRLRQRLPDWPRMPQDRALRLIARSGAAERGALLLALLATFDPMLHALAIDEIGASGDPSVIEPLLRVASGVDGATGYLQVKSIEAMGWLR